MVSERLASPLSIGMYRNLTSVDFSPNWAIPLYRSVGFVIQDAMCHDSNYNIVKMPILIHLNRRTPYHPFKKLSGSL